MNIPTRLPYLILAAASLVLVACGSTRDERVATGAIGGAIVGGPAGALAGANAGASISGALGEPKK
jgi:osmotically inducible lipoprotein OsmB